MNNVNKILDIKETIKEADIFNSNYVIIYNVEFEKTYNNYTYVLTCNKGTCTFAKHYLSDNHTDYVYPDNLLNDYRQTDSIPVLWNEFVECYINAHKANNKILPLIKIETPLLILIPTALNLAKMVTIELKNAQPDKIIAYSLGIASTKIKPRPITANKE